MSEQKAVIRQAQPEDTSPTSTVASHGLRWKAWLGRSVVAGLIIIIWALAVVFFIRSAEMAASGLILAAATVGIVSGITVIVLSFIRYKCV